MSIEWEDVLLAYLHDPPDKALALGGHLARAARYAEAVLGRPVAEQELKFAADSVAAVAERIPAPDWRVLTVGPKDSTLQVNHPLAGHPRILKLGALDEEWVRGQIDDLVRGHPDPVERRFLALWRLLPERLANSAHRWFADLPADTRVPDHTIWHHLDITAGLKAAGVGEGTGALLAFALGPVQRFIEASRSVRDLWSGSMLLSYLAFQAMLPVIEACGPTALVYPSLRGVPLLDLWLRQERGLSDVPMPDEDRRRTPCLPHRFVALVPWGLDGEAARGLAAKCEENAKKAWQQIARAVHNELRGPLRHLDTNWDRLWPKQIDSYLECRTAVLPWRSCSDEVLARLLADNDDFAQAQPNAGAVRRMAAAIPAAERPGYSQESAGGWQARVALVVRLLEAQRAVRPVPTDLATGWVPGKCSLFGTYEQMGPAELGRSADFWKEVAEGSPDDRGDRRKGVRIDGVRLRGGERLCAVALVKRFSGPCHLAEVLDLKREDLRFDDTATIAAADWLEAAEINPNEIRKQYRKHGWSGQWLHWPHPDFDPDEPCPKTLWDETIAPARRRADLNKPATYYAILKMDGDDLSEWLSGERSRPVREVMHPDLVSYFEGLGGTTRAGLDAKRPVGPALHAAISTALANFALHVVPEVVDRHKGVLVYSGGDDTLALLPTSRALRYAAELHAAYMQPYHRIGDRDYLMMGPRATLSAGLAIVHFKEDLSQALAIARAAETRAKEAGKDALEIIVCRRSGEHSSALCPWPYLSDVTGLVDAFLPRHGQPGASDRWAYHLAAERPTLIGLPEAAMRAEIRRQVDRADEDSRTRLGRGYPKEAGNELARSFGRYLDLVRGRTSGLSAREALAHFITLCQSASFLARGRDQ
jgi:CRISPR-associated protein Cmr2